MRTARVCATAAAAWCALGAWALPPDEPWVLRHPATDPVPYHGLVNHDAAEGLRGSVLYPAPSVAGLVVAVLAHAAISEGVRDARLQRLQAEADTVLQPLREQLSGFTHGQLLRLALEHVPARAATAVSADAPVAPTWQVGSAPVFIMTRDGRALVLENTIGIFAPGETQKARYSTTVRVVSQPRAEAEPVQAWREGDRLRQESARMLAHSLELALRDAARPAGEDAPARTLRYLLGPTEQVQRAQFLEAGCQRQVVRTLRGWLLSAPVNAPEGEASCDPSTFTTR